MTSELKVKAIETHQKVKELKNKLPVHLRVVPEIVSCVQLIESLCEFQLRVAQKMEECIYGQCD